jgi:hypothetical protein
LECILLFHYFAASALLQVYTKIRKVVIVYPQTPIPAMYVKIFRANVIADKNHNLPIIVRLYNHWLNFTAGSSNTLATTSATQRVNGNNTKFGSKKEISSPKGPHFGNGIALHQPPKLAL